MKSFPVLVFLVISGLALNVYAVEDNPEACDCKTLELTEKEEAGGCSSPVKEQTCPLYHDFMVWRGQLKHDQERRKIEKQMEPRYIPR